MVRFIALSGFLGAGKTTTMAAAARRLEASGRTVALITNDQGTDLVDTQTLRSTDAAVAEVSGGCFCCRFEDLAEATRRLIAQHTPDVIIAEAVGSCTDITATVIRPLRAFHGEHLDVAPATTIVDPLRLRWIERTADNQALGSDVAYLYRSQLLDAEVIGLNKTDLLTQHELDIAISVLAERAPQARIVSFSAARGNGLDDLIGLWEIGSDNSCVGLDVDYTRYGAAEAELAWLNQVLSISSTAETPFDPTSWGQALLDALAAGCREQGATIGHAKVALTSPGEQTKLSLTDADDLPSVDVQHSTRVRQAIALINARIHCRVSQVIEIVETSIVRADERCSTSTQTSRGSAFVPGYPSPTHRILAGKGV